MSRSARAIAVLISGGLDSGVLLAELSRKYRRVIPLYIRNGLCWEKIELYWLRRFLQALRRGGKTAAAVREISVLKLSMEDLYDGHWSLTGQNVPDYDSEDPSMYLPGRNLILLSKAALYCATHRISNLALGPLKGNPFPDAKKKFFQAFEKAASIGLNTPIRIQTPFLHLTKADVIARGRGLPLELTFSCIRPAGRHHCGRCNKCAERQRAFARAGMEDRTPYRTGRPLRARVRRLSHA